MPNIAHDKLQATAAILLECAGASAEEAEIVSRHSIAANLAGHDSHGIIKIPTYIARVKDRHIVPGAPFEITQETSTTTVINGNWGFGYVVSERAMEITIAKAREHGVAATTIFQQGHVGRLTDYPLMAAEAGMISWMTADSGRSPKSVAPFGGREARLGTNPLCIAVPSNLDGPFFIDFATSAAAGGKIEVAVSRGEEIPLGWILDKDGKPSSDPTQFKAGGVGLPLGGAEGYKGYGLSAMIEIFSGILPGLGFGVEPTGKHNDGVFMAAFNVDAFRPLETFKQEVTDFAHYLKNTKTADGFDEVLYPGELEHRCCEQKLAQGVFVEDATVAKLNGLAEEYGVTDKIDLS